MDTAKFPSLLLNDTGIIPEILDVRLIGKDVVPSAIPFPNVLGGNMATGCSETSTHTKLQDVTLHNTAVNMETSVSCFGGSCFTSRYAISYPEVQCVCAVRTDKSSSRSFKQTASFHSLSDSLFLITLSFNAAILI